MQPVLLKKYGWQKYFSNFNSTNNSYSLGRIVLQHRNKYKLVSEHGEIWVRSAGNLFYSNKDNSENMKINWNIVKDQINKSVPYYKTIGMRLIELGNGQAIISAGTSPNLIKDNQ